MAKEKKATSVKKASSVKKAVGVKKASNVKKTSSVKKTKGVTTWVIRRKTLGYNGLPVNSRFPYAFSSAKSARVVLTELGECACTVAKAWSGDYYDTRERGKSVVEVYSPDAAKDWYRQEFSVETRVDSNLPVLKPNEVPYDVLHKWVSPVRESDDAEDTEDSDVLCTTAGNWDRLELGDWAVILAKRPDLKDRLDFAKCYDPEHPSLSVYGLKDLLIACPDLMERAIKEAKPVLDKIGCYWNWILAKNPQLFRYCDELGYCSAWKEWSGNSWRILLSDQPQFSNLCDWSTFNESNWKWLLEHQPQFWGRCVESGMSEKVLESSPSPGCKFWRAVVSENPEMISKCPKENLDAELFKKIVEHDASAAHRLIDRFDTEEFYGSDWVDILILDPSFDQNCDWNQLSGNDWNRLITANATLLKYCPLQSMSSKGLATVFSVHPQLSKGFSGWGSFTASDWVILLREQPQFAEYCTCWDMFSEKDWCYLLQAQPGFEMRCKIWDKFSTKLWVELLCEQPQFARRCDFNFTPYKSFFGLEVDPWIELLSKRPEFADRCDLTHYDDLEKLTKKYYGFNFDYRPLLLPLLDKQPSLAERCNWDKLKIDRETLHDFIERIPARARLIVKHMNERLRTKYISMHDWAILLSEDSSFDEDFERAVILEW